MKKKVLLPIVLIAVVAFVLLNVFTAGDTHVGVVKDNIALVNENGQLKSENSQLKSENTKLLQLNNQLTADLTKATDAVASKESQKLLSKIIVTIEKNVDEDLGWCSPSTAYDLLKSKLGKTPSKSEYKQTLLDLVNKDMLYSPGTPDPYVKGKKITALQIDDLVN